MAILLFVITSAPWVHLPPINKKPKEIEIEKGPLWQGLFFLLLSIPRYVSSIFLNQIWCLKHQFHEAMKHPPQTQIFLMLTLK